MPQAAFARLKREERRRGEKVLLDSLGVKTKEEAKALLDKVRAAPSATPTPASATPATPGTVPTAPVTPEALTDTGRLEQRLRHIERQNKLLKASTSASEAGFKLQVEAVRCGIVDPEYALVLARRHLQGKDEAALRAFNPKAFFEGLKNTNPALFQAPLTVPAGQATAGVPVAVESLSNGKPAAAQAPTPGVPNGKSKDVRSMSREELSDYYRKLGLKDPTIGS